MYKIKQPHKAVIINKLGCFKMIKISLFSIEHSSHYKQGLEVKEPEMLL